jgi:hypothetical protein
MISNKNLSAPSDEGHLGNPPVPPVAAFAQRYFYDSSILFGDQIVQGPPLQVIETKDLIHSWHCHPERHSKELAVTAQSIFR